MNSKKTIWLGMLVGSTLGSYVPYLWGAGLFSSLLFGAIGAIIGIWLVFKISH